MIRFLCRKEGGFCASGRAGREAAGGCAWNTFAAVFPRPEGEPEQGRHEELLAQEGEYYQLYHGMFELS